MWAKTQTSIKVVPYSAVLPFLKKTILIFLEPNFAFSSVFIVLVGLR